MSSNHTGNVQPALDLEEHVSKGNVNAKRVVEYIYDALTDTLIPANQVLTSRFDIEDPIIYTGTAPIGSSESSPVWTVTKYDLTDLTAASGKVAEGIAWSSRSSGSYA